MIKPPQRASTTLPMPLRVARPIPPVPSWRVGRRLRCHRERGYFRKVYLHAIEQHREKSVDQNSARNIEGADSFAVPSRCASPRDPAGSRGASRLKCSRGCGNASIIAAKSAPRLVAAAAHARDYGRCVKPPSPTLLAISRTIPYLMTTHSVARQRGHPTTDGESGRLRKSEQYQGAGP